MVNPIKANLAIVLLGTIVTVLLLFGLNLIISLNDFSEQQINIWTFATSIIIFLLVGFFSGNIKSKNGLVNGVIASVVLVVVFIIISVVFTKSLHFPQIVRYIIMILSGGLGGILGVNFKPLVK